MKQKFNITGMTCSACSAHIEKSLSKTDGVRQIAVNLLANNMQIDYDETKLSEQDISRLVEDAGYTAAPATKAKALPESAAPRENLSAKEAQEKKRQFFSSLIFLLPLLYITMAKMLGLPFPSFFSGMPNLLPFVFTQFLLSLPIVYFNRNYFITGFKTLWHRSPNMDSLIAVGSSAALLYGIYAIYQIGFALGSGNHETAMQFAMDLYFESAATILTLITMGKWLEARSKSRTSEAISKLMDLTPKTATVLRDGLETEISVSDVVPGDIVIVRPGQSVPVDGIITEGNSAVDEAALTGESMPVEKQTGDKLIAATVNKNGYLQFRATRVGDDTTLAQIIRLVEEASSSKAPISKLADKVSGIFVPTVMAISLLATLVWLLLGYPFDFALSIGIAVLVISCPCALGLATPVAIMVGTGKGAENGILIKSAEALEMAHTIDTVILDKTGTVTEGKPRVTDFLTLGSVSSEELLQKAAAVEAKSEHPLAEAILLLSKEKGISIPNAADFQVIPGQGISAVVNGKTVSAGNLKMMQTLAIETAELVSQADAFAEDGKTPLYFAEDHRLLGIIAAADVVKPTSTAAIAALKKLGIDVIMLTGDNQRTAAAIQRKTGIDRVVAEVLPQDKELEIRKLQAQGKVVAMIGDGINDAPALARADVGIAIGAGTDVAIESADIVLMKSDLLDAVTAIELSKAVIRNIKQNLFWAFFYNILGIPLAAGVFYSLLGWKLNPMFAAAAMSFSSVSVVTNALRLKLFRPQLVARQLTAENSEAPAKSEPLFVQNIDRVLKIKENEKGVFIMTKKMIIEGMSCMHCVGRVEKALNAIAGVSAQVDLASKTAVITLSAPIDDAVLIAAVSKAGYEVVSLV
ncbi:MAG: heavy metal translocating P-type ATPase [Negativicutes bacterium]|nr:heavy metal translocating P-type ATPase [Negativicutes bacterium]